MVPGRLGVVHVTLSPCSNMMCRPSLFIRGMPLLFKAVHRLLTCDTSPHTADSEACQVVCTGSPCSKLPCGAQVPTVLV